MNRSVWESKIRVVNPITKLPTEQLVVYNLRERDDLIRDKSFLRLSIQNWESFTKVCDKKLGADLLYFVSTLILEVLDEVGTSEGQLCQSDDDSFTIIDSSAVISKIQEYLQRHFTAEALSQEPFYISVLRKQVNGDKIPASLRLVTKSTTANDFLQIDDL